MYEIVVQTYEMRLKCDSCAAKLPFRLHPSCLFPRIYPSLTLSVFRSLLVPFSFPLSLLLSSPLSLSLLLSPSLLLSQTLPLSPSHARVCTLFMPPHPHALTMSFTCLHALEIFSLLCLLTYLIRAIYRRCDMCD